MKRQFFPHLAKPWAAFRGPLDSCIFSPGWKVGAHTSGPRCLPIAQHPLQDWVTEHQGVRVILLKCPWARTQTLPPKTAASVGVFRSASEPASTAPWGASAGSAPPEGSRLLEFLRELSVGRDSKRGTSISLGLLFHRFPSLVSNFNIFL